MCLRMVTCIKNIATINSRFRGVTDSTNDFGSAVLVPNHVLINL